HPVEQAETVREDTIEHAHLFAQRKPRPMPQGNKALPVLARLKRCNDVGGYRNRVIAIADETRHSDGRLDRAPPLAHHVDGDEEIAREQWSHDGLDPTRVSPALEITRQIGVKSLARQMRGGLAFRVRMGLNHVPARAHSAASSRAIGVSPSS